MKRLIKLLMTTVLVVSLNGCTQKKEEPNQNELSKITISFKIVDVKEDKILFDGPVEVSSDCKTLADVLSAAPELQAITKEGSYGLALISLMGVEGDWDKGPWWVYESENNESCKKMGFCDGISNLQIADKDEFLFKLTSEF